MQLFSGLQKITSRLLPVTFRSYSANAQPIEMASDVFESSRTDASKPPLLIMHGLFGSRKNWRSISRSLIEKTGRKVITVDARNHGESPHTKEHSSLHMSLDIIHLMKRNGIQNASVMGHSMGGRTMMYLALKFPQYVRNGIIVDISPIAVPRDFSQMEQLFLALKNVKIPNNLSIGDGRKYAEKEIKKAVDQKETVDFILLNLRKQNGVFSWAINIDSLHNNLRHFDQFSNRIAGLEPYKGRMMFVCGKQSNFVDPDSWPQIQKYFPNSEIHWLDAGHLVHFDQPVQFVELMVQFLNEE